MSKAHLKIPAFFAAWLFAFSLLSNCYCAPPSVSPHSAQPMAHCSHHGSKAKDCAPRYNTDQFENMVIQAQPVHAQAQELLVPELQEKQSSVPVFEFSSKPFFDSSPPQLYLQHHAFLI